MADNDVISSDPVGEVVNITGEAQAVSNSNVRDLAIGSEIFQGDTVITGPGCQLEIDFIDETSLSQAENSRSTISAYVYDADNAENSSLLFEMAKGVFRTVTGEIAKQNPDNFNLKSPMALIGIRGTVVNSDIQDAFEKIGVETIGQDHVLVIQDMQGNIRFISSPLKILEINQGEPLGFSRDMTRQELEHFQHLAPNSIDIDPEQQMQLEKLLDAAESGGAAEMTGTESVENSDQIQAASDSEAAADDGGSTEAPSDIVETEASQNAVQGTLETREVNLINPSESLETDNPENANSLGLVVSDEQEPLNFYQAETFHLADEVTTDQEVAEDQPFTEVDPGDLDVINTAPSAVSDNATTLQETPVVVDVLSNDLDEDGDELSVTAVGQGQHGTVEINGDNTVTYTPEADYNGDDVFTYTVSDGNGGESTATVTVTIKAANVPPEAVDDSADTSENEAVVIDVLSNDLDKDGDELSVAAVGQGQHGTVAINGDNTVTYTPEADYNGDDVFTYTVSDGNGGESTATVTVTIKAANVPPEAVDDSADTSENKAVVIDVLSNDLDKDGDELSVAAVGQGQHGTVEINGDNTVTYTPEADYNGDDVFTYTVSDGNGGESTATVTVTIKAANVPPEAVDDSADTSENKAVVIDVLSNDLDEDEDELSVAEVSQGQHGTVEINGDNTVTYTPEADYNGDDVFTYTVSDGKGGEDTGTVFVTIKAANVPPEAVDDNASTLENTAVVIDVLSNDLDEDGDALSVMNVGQGQHGTVEINEDNTVTYTPEAGYTGEDTFTYTVSDGKGGEDTGEVNISIVDGGGDDYIIGTPGDDYINGFGGNDTIDGVEGDDTLVGGDGADILIGGKGEDLLYGDDLSAGQKAAYDLNDSQAFGLDVATYANDPQAVSVGMEGDSISVVDGWGGIDTLIDIESIRGSAFDDTFSGDGREMFYEGGAGNDWIDGGLSHGVDNYGWMKISQNHVIVSYENDPVEPGQSGITVDLNEGNGSSDGIVVVDGYGDIDILQGIDGVFGSSGDDSLTGRDNENNWLAGGQGNDTLDGGDLIDNISSNQLSYQYDPDNDSDGMGIKADIHYDAGSGTFYESYITDGWGDVDTVNNINMIIGSDYNDSMTIHVDPAGDGVSAEEDDAGMMWYLWGMDGADTLVGTPTADVAAMYLDDPVNGEGNGVTVYLDSGEGESGQGYAVDGWGNTDVLVNLHVVAGSDFADTIQGSGDADTFFGTIGDDMLDGAGGQDVISYEWLGSENDFDGLDIDLEQGRTLIYGMESGGNEPSFTQILTSMEHVWGSVFNDTIQGDAGENELAGNAGDDGLFGGDGHDTLSGDGDSDALWGGEGDDLLDGGPGDDFLYGEGGDDFLSGGEGKDWLEGGDGNDIFSFTAAGYDNVDTVSDFNAAAGRGDATIGSEDATKAVGDEGITGNWGTLSGDVIQFQEDQLGFFAQGAVEYKATTFAFYEGDPTEVRIIGIADQQALEDWSDVNNVIESAIDVSLGDGSNDATYFVVSNGSDTKIYYWEGDTLNPDDNHVDMDELHEVVLMESFSTEDIGMLTEDNFDGSTGCI